MYGFHYGVACVASGFAVIWYGATCKQDPDSPRLVRELCPMWWYRFVTIAFGLVLVLIGLLGTSWKYLRIR
jgi:hypothetical protein